MVVDVQAQDPSRGLTGDLAWATITTPILLEAIFEASRVEWAGDVKLPHAINGATKMRLRISELDFFQSTTPRATVDTTQRRPFVAHLPLS